MARILLAEDNDANRELLREILESLGHEIIEAEDGQQAWERLAERPPDLLVCDLQMPNLDGFGLLRKVQERFTPRNFQIIALTAYAMDGDRERALDAGFDGYLSKPIDLRQLREMVKQVLERGDRA